MTQTERPLNLPVRTENDPDPAVSSVLAAVRARSGRIPNMYARMVNSPALLESYLYGYDRFRADSSFTPGEQQVVLLAISRVNGCTYCVAAHSGLAAAAHVPTEVITAIRDGRPVPDERLDALARLSVIMVESRGLPSAADLDAFFGAGFTETDVLSIVLAISVKTISNYTNHLFHTPVDAASARWEWQG